MVDLFLSSFASHIVSGVALLVVAVAVVFMCFTVFCDTFRKNPASTGAEPSFLAICIAVGWLLYDQKMFSVNLTWGEVVSLVVAYALIGVLVSVFFWFRSVRILATNIRHMLDKHNDISTFTLLTDSYYRDIYPPLFVGASYSKSSINEDFPDMSEFFPKFSRFGSQFYCIARIWPLTIFWLFDSIIGDVVRGLVRYVMASLAHVTRYIYRKAVGG